jgi:serine/threonine protein phosphatase PrpC
MFGFVVAQYATAIAPYELSGEVADDCIATILSETTDAQTRVDRLIAADQEAGGKDNVTVIVINSR